MTRTISTFFFVGCLPTAPGTWGSIAALPVAYVLHLAGGFPLLLIATIVTFVAGWWATRRETEGKADHDPSEIVVDEVVGQWVALLPVSAVLTLTDAQPPVPLLAMLGAFLLFRLFDISKFGLVGTFDRMGSAFGVMMDDVIAGIMAAVGLLGLMAVASLFV